MVHKLDEFITQQQTSSKRALSVFGPMSNASKLKVKQKDEGKCETPSLKIQNPAAVLADPPCRLSLLEVVITPVKQRVGRS
jgi:hypothetical protein